MAKKRQTDSDEKATRLHKKASRLDDKASKLSEKEAELNRAGDRSKTRIGAGRVVRGGLWLSILIVAATILAKHAGDTPWQCSTYQGLVAWGMATYIIGVVLLEAVRSTIRWISTREWVWEWVKDPPVLNEVLDPIFRVALSSPRREDHPHGVQLTARNDAPAAGRERARLPDVAPRLTHVSRPTASRRGVERWSLGLVMTLDPDSPSVRQTQATRGQREGHDLVRGGLGLCTHKGLVTYLLAPLAFHGGASSVDDTPPLRIAPI